MALTINQFMWGFQPHFRSEVEYEIRKILSEIGLQTESKVRVFLVGLANKDGFAHKICIEPKYGPLVAEDLQSIEKRTGEIFSADPEYEMFHSDPRIHQARRRSLLLDSRASALAEAIEASGKYEGLTFFVSRSAPIGGYDVHTCVGIPSEALESVPKFNNPKRDDYRGRYIEESFVQAIVHTCLMRADKTLYLPDPGDSFFEILGSRVDIIRSSAERFVRGITSSLTPQDSDLFRYASDFSSLTYERSGAKGHIAVTHPDNLANKLKIRFESRVSLSEARTVRKMLELTDDSTCLLADSGHVYGLGECNSAPDVAKLSIEGHAMWSISIDDTALMRVSYEHAELPRQILDKDLFADVAKRTVDAVEVDRIWEIVQRALQDDHGTTIVVSKNPAAEIKRLAQQALPIKPEYLEHSEVARLGRVDGAIVLGPDGRCHAFGVILDGLATSSGDRARGARFNSSVRYQQTSDIGAMVIVISDDGTVDLIPHLMPRVWRHEVEYAVQAFCDYTGIEDKNGREWGERWDRVEGYQFYLDGEQCSRVNESYKVEMDSRKKSGGFVLINYPILQPHPDMNDTYFLDS